jgi:hypothetical protein
MKFASVLNIDFGVIKDMAMMMERRKIPVVRRILGDSINNLF